MQLPPGNNYNAKSTGWYKWHSSKRGELVSSPCFASGIFLPKEYQPVPRTSKDGGGAAHQPFQIQLSRSQKWWAEETPAKPSTDIASPKGQGSKSCWRWFLTTRLETKPHLKQPCLCVRLTYSNLMIKRNMGNKEFLCLPLFTLSWEQDHAVLSSWTMLNFEV